MKKNTAGYSRSLGEVRIIAGLWRGRKLSVLNKEGLRPTSDRVRETLFNWLMPYIVDARCLDCYSGSGALGFEALSRHANYVLMLEKDTQISKQLIKNLSTLNSDKAKIKQTDTLNFLSQPITEIPFDIVFIDPPFHYGLAQQTIDKLATQPWLAQNALIYVEVEKENTTLTVPDTWQLLKEKSTQQVSYRLYQYQGE